IHSYALSRHDALPIFALVDDVVTLECGHRHEMQRSRLEADTLGKGQVVGLDALEHALIEVHQVHLVDGHDDVLDAQQGGDKAVRSEEHTSELQSREKL